MFIDPWPICMLCSKRLYESLLHNGSAFINERLTWGGNHNVKHYSQICAWKAGRATNKVLFRLFLTGRSDTSSNTKWASCLYYVVWLVRKQLISMSSRYICRCINLNVIWKCVWTGRTVLICIEDDWQTHICFLHNCCQAHLFLQ